MLDRIISHLIITVRVHFLFVRVQFIADDFNQLPFRTIETLD